MKVPQHLMTNLNDADKWVNSNLEEELKEAGTLEAKVEDIDKLLEIDWKPARV